MCFRCLAGQLTDEGRTWKQNVAVAHLTGEESQPNPGTCSDLVPVTPPLPLPHKQETPTARGQITEWSMANRQIPKALVEYTFPWRPFIRNLEKQWSTEQMSRRNHDEGARVSYNKDMVVIYSTLSENVESNYTEAYIILAN